MKRAIVDYHIDEHDDWVAELDCYHNQHVRHDPPFQNRPWVETAAGREEMLGSLLDCKRCDRFEFPPGLTGYKETPEFTEITIPVGLQGEHTTRTGVWGLIHVISGQLHYHASGQIRLLEPGVLGVVVPEMPHCVKAAGKVRFFVAFHRREIADAE